MTARIYNPIVLIRIGAAALLAAVLFSIFRYAMALRWAKVSRQRQRESEESRGRRIVAEIPVGGDAVTLFLEDEAGFYWGPESARKPDVVGARLRLNGGILASWARPGVTLPEPAAPEEYEGRERWDVELRLADGQARVVPCGTLREGVSREIAARVFNAVRDAGRG